MDFLGVSPLQLLTIVVIAYVFLGPKKMGETGRTLGKALRQLRRHTAEFTALLMEDTEAEEARKKSEPPAPTSSVARDASAPSGEVRAPASEPAVNGTSPEEPVSAPNETADQGTRGG